jgi:hypothetical protein
VGLSFSSNASHQLDPYLLLSVNLIIVNLKQEQVKMRFFLSIMILLQSLVLLQQLNKLESMKYVTNDNEFSKITPKP